MTDREQILCSISNLRSINWTCSSSSANDLKSIPPRALSYHQAQQSMLAPLRSTYCCIHIPRTSACSIFAPCCSRSSAVFMSPSFAAFNKAMPAVVHTVFLVCVSMCYHAYVWLTSVFKTTTQKYGSLQRYINQRELSDESALVMKPFAELQLSAQAAFVGTNPSTLAVDATAALNVCMCLCHRLCVFPCLCLCPLFVSLCSCLSESVSDSVFLCAFAGSVLGKPDCRDEFKLRLKRHGMGLRK